MDDGSVMCAEAYQQCDTRPKFTNLPTYQLPTPAILANDLFQIPVFGLRSGLTTMTGEFDSAIFLKCEIDHWKHPDRTTSDISFIMGR